jgi:glycosyltransferase involved in cell wall biosynthesis
MNMEDESNVAAADGGAVAELAAEAPRNLRLLVLTDRVGATQAISFTQPIDFQSGQIERVETFTYQESKLAYLTQDEYWRHHKPSVLFLSRYTDARIFPVLEMARRSGVPSVFHIDDDLLEITTAMSADRVQHYQDPERIRVLRSALYRVDLVYASTPALASRLVDHGVTTKIVAGDLYCSVDPAKLAPPMPATGPVIGYMGSASHSADLALVLPALARLMRAIPSLRFETFGTIPPPPEMAEFGSRYSHHAGDTNYAGFLAKLSELGWWAGIAPLEDNTFNRCKADTKWVEYSSAGMAVVASDLPVYQKACADGCGLLAATEEDWYTHLEAVVRDGGLRGRLLACARAKLADQYNHRALERQLISVIEQAQAEYREHQLGA